MQTIPFDLSGLAGIYFRRIWALQRTFNWQLLMPDTINGLFGLLVSQYCEDVRFGDYSINSISSLRYGPKQRFYADLEEIKSVTLVFISPVDNSVLNYFYGWRELIIDKDGYYSAKNRYSKTIYIALYDRSGVESTQFVLRGCWPKTNPSLGLSYPSEDVLRLELEMSVDRISHKSLIGSILEGVTNFAKGSAKGVLGKIGF